MAEIGSDGLRPLTTKPGLVDRVVGALKGAAKAFEIDSTPVSIEKINAGTLASTIDSSIYNPLREAGGNRFANGFDIAIAMAALNYPRTLMSDDLSAKYPDVYQKTRNALADLEKRGVLVVTRDPDTQEITRYFVGDEAKLKEIASKARSSK